MKLLLSRLFSLSSQYPAPLCLGWSYLCVRDHAWNSTFLQNTLESWALFYLDLLWLTMSAQLCSQVPDVFL